LGVEAHYAGYIERQGTEIDRQKREAGTRLPQDFDYAEVNGLSNELREKLARIRQNDVGQAARISGMTPAAISLLLVEIKKRSRTRAAGASR
jgi:tRNA uridine 5-carboxymethylaminomethyl modification enzyme